MPGGLVDDDPHLPILRGRISPANIPKVSGKRLLPAAGLALAGLGLRLSISRVVSWPLTRFSAAKQYTQPLWSQVPTTGRTPFTPRVARRVGTRGKRASSWLNHTHSPAWAFF
jgi:hypothetical protein